jgi:hypothetical protein
MKMAIREQSRIVSSCQDRLMVPTVHYATFIMAWIAGSSYRLTGSAISCHGLRKPPQQG